MIVLAIYPARFGDRRLARFLGLVVVADCRHTYRLRSRTPGFRPSVNSNPAASSTWRRLSIVRLRIVSPASKRMTVSGDTFAAVANFLALKPIAALAIRHCTGSNSEPFHAPATRAVQERHSPNGETPRAQYV